MTERRDIGAEILEGLRELKRGDAGRAMTVPDVRNIRENAGLSQSEFAALLGVSIRTVQDWEQHRRAPSGAARTLLTIAHKYPGVLLQVALQESVSDPIYSLPLRPGAKTTIHSLSTD